MEYLSPTLDIVFKKMFSSSANADMLKSLLNAYLGIDDLGEYALTNVEITPETLEKKFSRLDLRVSTEKEEIDIEVQVLNKDNYSDRCLYYWATLYGSSVERGEDYGTSKATLSLNILDFNLFSAEECEDFNTEFVFYDPKHNLILTDKARINIVELPKIRNATPEQIKSSEKIAWAAFFNAESEEDFDMIRQTTSSPNVQKAVTVIRQLSEDEKMIEAARMRKNAIFNERSSLAGAREKGIAEGMKMGMEKGIEKGIEKGMEKMANSLRAMGMSEEKIQEAIRLYKERENDVLVEGASEEAAEEAEI